MDLGEFLWTLLVIYFIFFFFMILFRILGDLFSDHSTSGLAKTGWIVFLLLLPFLGIFVYLITRGQGMTERSIAQAKAMDAAQRDYIRETAGGGAGADPAAQIAKGQELLSSGAITQQEFDAIKAKALA
jgi:Phospholipase_D-nuclease N-terminal